MKRLLALLLILCLSLGMAACGGGDEGGDAAGGGTAGTEDSGIISRIDKMLSAQGRSYDKLITGKVGETLTNAFFDFKITDVQATDALEDFKPNVEGNKFIVADVEVKNIMEEEIPVGNYDFTIIWDSEVETVEEDHWAYTVFMDGMYPDDETLAVGKSLSGKLVFEIPADVSSFAIAYEEIYEDDMVGDTYAVECTL